MKRFVFSSTVAVYVESENIPNDGVDKSFEMLPINPYGFSKLMSEKIICDSAKANKDFKYVIFRYFNVAGADMFYENKTLNPRIGSFFPNTTHLIKISCECACKKEIRCIFLAKIF